ncbi:MAG: hypothetical protein KA745_00245 [Gemmatimonadales bacterium]|nr:hypothetical protein [Gemmatimonadales bacterium]
MTNRVFATAFSGVRNREVYPTDFEAGDECPAELIAAAEEIGALEPAEEPGPVDPAKEAGKSASKGKAKPAADDETQD